MTQASQFWDRMAERYAQQPIADQAAYQTKLEVTRRYFRPSMDVLEFGCGTGSTALAHAPYVRHILATDFSARMIDIARTRARDSAVANVTFEQIDIDGLARRGGSYDAILGMSILHLLRNPLQVMAQVHAMLTPGGVFVSSTACLGDSMKFFKFIAPLGHALGLLPILNVMTADQLGAGLVATGFTIDHTWQPGPNKAVFIVARKAE